MGLLWKRNETINKVWFISVCENSKLSTFKRKTQKFGSYLIFFKHHCNNAILRRTQYVVNPMEMTNKLPELISEQAAEHKIKAEKSISPHEVRTNQKQNYPNLPTLRTPSKKRKAWILLSTKLMFRIMQSTAEKSGRGLLWTEGRAKVMDQKTHWKCGCLARW